MTIEFYSINLKELYKLTQPTEDWKPVFDSPKAEEPLPVKGVSDNVKSELEDDSDRNSNENLAFEMVEKF